MDAYREQEVNGDTRVYLALDKNIAPVKCAVLPLVKKPAVSEPARELFEKLRQVIPGKVIFDAKSTIGKRYRKQDEIGTPFAITFDFDSLEDGKVTLRHRDTMEQERISIEDVMQRMKQAYSGV